MPANFPNIEESKMGVKCYWLEPIYRARLHLRRYTLAERVPCAASQGSPRYHTAMTEISEVDENWDREHQPGGLLVTHAGPQSRSDVQADAPWPVKCEHCDYVFQDDDEWQIFSESLYRRTDSGAILKQSEFGPGAMWNAEYLVHNPFYLGPDGRSIIVILPNGNEWTIDGPCRNCTNPEDSTHKCWCRHGDPPNLTIDKNCNSCSAGGGSIQSGDYHGFLVNGVFNP
jgi:hypothetical protein